MQKKSAPPLRRKNFATVSESDLYGTICEVRGAYYIVRTPEGDTYTCKTLRTTLTENPNSTLAVVGDRVRFRPDEERNDVALHNGVITFIEKRRSVLARSRDRRRNRSGELEHVIASNIDQLVIVSSFDKPPFRPKLIDRYIAFAEFEGLVPLLVLNKVDLDTAGEAQTLVQPYCQLGYEVLLLSARCEKGLEALREKLTGKTSVFSGHSGVGKTTLVNKLTGSNLATGELSGKSGKGAHTTSNAIMLPVLSPEGKAVGYIIDTPGIREFGLEGIAREELRHLFVEFRKFAPECAFASCTHTNEPNCAVVAAVERGEIWPSRYESYLTLFAEASA
ncbi:MAG: ribosome small subunit-dependent GTPase A [Chloroherpetonaceae bacterium]|nr:ribosome small subunit-dependent GTPase A [Chloroherpetonaceae bacterium]MCS7210784.1 ribosome small subunit-dependent GTPase A [Chloroherpetonaceae bacterium]MDW8019480.1 ribosome small subunit-dependent GTPase A [Chloroherpetonaceae bacterium]MDW8465888.1 ribosome small subunit-dependent GTPase A [Chloroherpetonaceae bacterium]